MEDTRVLRSPRVSVEPKAEATAEVGARRFGLAGVRNLFRRREKPETLAHDDVGPAVILACEKCGFDYRVERIDFGQGKIGAFWMCACGSRYIPPGGEESYNLLRP